LVKIQETRYVVTDLSASIVRPLSNMISYISMFRSNYQRSTQPWSQHPSLFHCINHAISAVTM